MLSGPRPWSLPLEQGTKLVEINYRWMSCHIWYTALEVNDSVQMEILYYISIDVVPKSCDGCIGGPVVEASRVRCTQVSSIIVRDRVRMQVDWKILA